MRIDIVTLFPELVNQVTEFGIPRRAREMALLELKAWNPRDYANDRHRTVDDRPYGGGPGMIMLYEPLARAIDAARAENTDAKVIYLTPQGRPLEQRGVAELAGRHGLILLAGRYEGVDERLIESRVDEEWSIGDYVLSGGELAAMVVVDAVARLLPGALGNRRSAGEDSFSEGLLECPHFTRPEQIDGRGVPSLLLQGDHALIDQWRKQQALVRTFRRRPDLLRQLHLSSAQRALVARAIAPQLSDNERPTPTDRPSAGSDELNEE